MRVWVPTDQVADALAGLPGVTVNIVNPDVFITPHVAGSTPASSQSALTFVRDQVQRFHNGQQLLNVITGEY